MRLFRTVRWQHWHEILVVLNVLRIFLEYQNATDYLRDMCSHLQVDGALLISAKTSDSIQSQDLLPEPKNKFDQKFVWPNFCPPVSSMGGKKHASLLNLTALLATLTVENGAVN